MIASSDKLNWKFIEAIISGPFYASIVLLIPFGMLTGLSVVLDPSFVIYEFLPEELLFIPWFFLSILISLGNIRISSICGSGYGKKRIITINNINTKEYMKKSINNASENIAHDISICIEKMKSKQIKSLTNRRKEYGIDIIIEDKSNQIISIAVSSASRENINSKGLNIIVELLISFEPPFFPWKRIKYDGNIELKMQIEQSIEELLKKRQFIYLSEYA